MIVYGVGVICLSMGFLLGVGIGALAQRQHRYNVYWALFPTHRFLGVAVSQLRTYWREACQHDLIWRGALDVSLSSAELACRHLGEYLDGCKPPTVRRQEENEEQGKEQESNESTNAAG